MFVLYCVVVSTGVMLAPVVGDVCNGLLSAASVTVDVSVRVVEAVLMSKSQSVVELPFSARPRDLLAVARSLVGSPAITVETLIVTGG